MSQAVTVTLPNDVYQNITQFATITQRTLSDALIEIVRFAFVSALPMSQETPILNLPDNEVVALTTAQMAPHQGTRLSELLALHSEEELNPTDYQELMALMQIYNQLWIRQSEALAEAVQRGLIAPLSS